jgi:uncharacterized MAPEG superfamily protein
MTTELTLLAYSVALFFVLILVQVVVGVRAQGAMPLADSRDNLPPPTVLQARVGRCVENHREGLTLFAPLILIAALSHISNEATVLGSQLFFFSRVAHAAIYLTGLPKIRPLVWAVGITGTIMVFAALVGWTA